MKKAYLALSESGEVCHFAGQPLYYIYIDGRLKLYGRDHWRLIGYQLLDSF